jgi:hypothetical protein
LTPVRCWGREFVLEIVLAMAPVSPVPYRLHKPALVVGGLNQGTSPYDSFNFKSLFYDQFARILRDGKNPVKRADGVVCIVIDIPFHLSRTVICRRVHMRCVVGLDTLSYSLLSFDHSNTKSLG